MPRKQNSNATQWTPERNQFLRDHFFNMTNKQLADSLGLRLTVVRNQTRALGLKRYDYENWTAEEIQFLKDNYQVLGDMEIMEHMMANRPERSPMQRKAIRKKRKSLNLNRTPDQIKAIQARHVVPGGRSYTITKNSGSVVLSDTVVANYLSRDGVGINQDLKAHILETPELINLKRQQILLKRKIKEARNAKA
jgi:hypothetical protein